VSLPSFTGVVLTGGSSTRMGQDKSLLEVGGVALASLVAAALNDAGASEVIAVGGDIANLARLTGIDRAVPDLHPGEGPLGGVLTAFEFAHEDVVVILACDTPQVGASTPTALVAGLSLDHQVAVSYAVVSDRIQPLTAAWRRSLAWRPLQEAFEQGVRAPRSVLGDLTVSEVRSIAPEAVDDVDHPEDLQRYAAGSYKLPTQNEGNR
jgi:molybdopterin-guanine dinucleotide biosynthesis protein A